MDNKLTDTEVQELIERYPLGNIDSTIDERDFLYESVCATEQELPNAFTLDYNYPILDQGQVGSCVAHSIAEMKSYIDSVESNNMYSVGFIYTNRKENDSQNSGMIPRQALSNVVSDGDCLYDDFPINEEYPSILTTLDKYGKDKLLLKANQHKSKAYVKLTTEQIKEYLFNEKKPILITVSVYSSFYEAKYRNGIISKDPYGKFFGGHAMAVVGWDGDMLKVLNSWGQDFGDNGYVYIDINSSIIKELWALEDVRIIKPTYTTLYRVQVVAVKSKSDALLEMQDSLNKQNIANCLIYENGFYKLQCGCFSIKDNAIATKDKLVSLGYKDAWITEYKK